MAYYRNGEHERILVIGNFKMEEQEIDLIEPYRKILLNNYDTVREAGNKLVLMGYQVLVLLF